MGDPQPNSTARTAPILEHSQRFLDGSGRADLVSVDRKQVKVERKRPDRLGHASE